MEKIVPFTIEENDICPNCKMHSLKFINQYNKRVNIKEAEFHKFIIHKIICTNCNKEYEIQWEENEVSVNRDDYSKRVFLENNFYSKEV